METPEQIAAREAEEAKKAAEAAKPTTEELLKNREAELARKNEEIVRLRNLQAQKDSQPVKRDPYDITTWSDTELKMLKNSNDASVAQYKDRADELLLERRVAAIHKRQMEDQKRVETDAKLKEQYPEAADPSSEFSSKMEKIMQDYDLAKTPAGRLVAAKIVAAEGKSSDKKAEIKEANRVANVKSQLVDGDRPKPTETAADLEKTNQTLEAKLKDTKNEKGQIDAVAQILKSRGMDRDKFFKR
jgi:hypothetical protein